jgi:cystathionine gamma-synthase
MRPKASGAVARSQRRSGRDRPASVAGSPLEVPEALVRLSVGIEAAADLIADLTQALDRA